MNVRWTSVQNRPKRSGDRDVMCESVEKYAQDYAEKYAEKREIKTKIDIAKDLIRDAGFSVDQAVKFLKIGKDQQEFFVSQLQK